MWNNRELRNVEGDGNENVKKEIGLDQQNNNFARASRCFVYFFAVKYRFRIRRRRCCLSLTILFGSRNKTAVGTLYLYNITRKNCKVNEIVSEKS